ncbi:MAG: inositol monophosphatase [Opitutae bacterium]|nr:inositol monophosphatase [Opitutae bacterium]
MRLSAEDLIQLVGCAATAAMEAGILIAQYDGREVLLQHKAGGESLASQVVTEVDELSQAIILKHLLPTCAVYDLALLTEEQPDDGSRLEKDAFWCIDPLDGTLPFTESIPGYAVSIALVARDGTPLIGVVYDPSTGTQYQAVQGQGALRNGEPWTLPPSSEAAPLSFISDRSIVIHPQFGGALAQLQVLASELGQVGLETTLTGGAVMNALWVLEQAPACYFKFPKPQAGGGSLWDYAATACIYAELGAWCSDVAGQRLDLNRADSTFMNHRGVLFASDRALGQALLVVLVDLSDGE